MSYSSTTAMDAARRRALVAAEVQKAEEAKALESLLASRTYHDTNAGLGPTMKNANGQPVTDINIVRDTTPAQLEIDQKIAEYRKRMVDRPMEPAPVVAAPEAKDPMAGQLYKNFQQAEKDEILSQDTAASFHLKAIEAGTDPKYKDAKKGSAEQVERDATIKMYKDRAAVDEGRAKTAAERKALFASKLGMTNGAATTPEVSYVGKENRADAIPQRAPVVQPTPRAPAVVASSNPSNPVVVQETTAVSPSGLRKVNIRGKLYRLTPAQIKAYESAKTAQEQKRILSGGA